MSSEPIAAKAAAAFPGPDRAGLVPADVQSALWYRDAVIYQLNVKAFFDTNDDGMGDFKGVTAKLDYVKELGVNTIWLMPFYPSPLRDDGYDIANYDDIHPQYGTLDDFKAMLAEAHKRDLKVITELVINHTSDQHPWFQAARHAPPGSPEREFYVWSDTDQKYQGTRIIFTDTEVSNWTWDPVAKAYFWHRFFSHQPDLNYDNPLVLEAIFKTMRFWLDMGVDGFRLDAIPYLVEREGTSNENLYETHAVIKKLRAAIDQNYPNRFLLAEANMWPEDVREYFGDGDECHAAYHFPLMPRMYMSIAQEDRFPLTEIMQQTPDIPPGCQWAIFLRNHDELTLEMVTSKERDYMYSTYASDPRARINLGIRRRLAPLMDNDIERIKLMNSLLLSMPGSPIIYYGDEIGMGDNVYVGDRNGVRTPMQWSPDRNAGFSRADPQRLYLPPIMDANYGFQAVNVEAQSRDPSSLLNWMRRMLAVRQTSQAFGRGELVFLKPGNRKVLAYLRSHGEDVFLCVANLARTAQPVELDLAEFKGRVPVEAMGRTAFPPIGELPYLLTLAAHGFYWFRLATDVAVPSWHEQRLPAEERPVLVLFDGWNSLFRDEVVPWRITLAVKTRALFESDTLPRYVETQRWSDAKAGDLASARLADHAVWEEGRNSWLLPLVQLERAQPSPGPAGEAADDLCFLPLALAWEEADEARMHALGPSAMARVRQQAAIGVMADAFADEVFCRALVSAIGVRRELKTGGGVLRFEPTASFADIADSGFDALPVGRPQVPSSHTLVTLGERLLIKGYRTLVPGSAAGFETGRFLTDVQRFPHCVPLAGGLHYVARDGSASLLAMLQANVANQGDGASFALAYLQRFFEQQRSEPEASPPDVHGAFFEAMAVLGRRTAEMHLALAQRTGNPAFDPEPMGPADGAAWREAALAQTQASFTLLESEQRNWGETEQALARRALALRGAAEGRLREVPAEADGGFKIRIHGDYRLRRVLRVKNDFMVIGFAGTPGSTPDARRAKRSPLLDLAAMLRSLGEARVLAVNAALLLPGEGSALPGLGTTWEAGCREALLRAYRETTAGPHGLAPGSALPGERNAGLLAAFELEHALGRLQQALARRSSQTEAMAPALQSLTDLLEAA